VDGEWQYSLDSSNGVNGSWTNCVADSGSNPDSFAPYEFRWQTLPASGTDNQVWLRARLLDDLGFYSSYTTHLFAVNNTALDPTIAQTVTASDLNASLYLPPNALAGATVVTLTPSTSIPAHPTAGINSLNVGYYHYRPPDLIFHHPALNHFRPHFYWILIKISIAHHYHHRQIWIFG